MGATCTGPLLGQILGDETLTAGLTDPEARILVEWLVERVERLSAEAETEDRVREQFRRLCQRARLVRQFVVLWCHRQDAGAAAQLAACVRASWPLPSAAGGDPCDVMTAVLASESEERSSATPGCSQTTGPV
jgi:hypothetical protein